MDILCYTAILFLRTHLDGLIIGSWEMGLVHLCLYLEQSIELRVGHLLVLDGGGSSVASGCWSSDGSVRRRRGGGSGR